MKRFKQAKDIRVGVIGYGGAFNMGKCHLQQMHKAGMTPLAVAEIDPKRLVVAKEEFPGIETYTSVATMLKKSDVNLITIITPHNTHARLALQCLRAGRSVVCEKPLAITTDECDRMIAEARKRDVVLSTYHNRHWDGCILEAVKRIRRGEIGEIIRIEAHMGGYGKPRDWWRSSKSISGGILYDWGVHLLEYSLQLIDSDIVEVTGFAKNGFWADQLHWKKDTNEDEAHAVVRFRSGQWLELTISEIDVNSKSKDRGWLEITGTKGTYLFNHDTFTVMTPNGITKRGKNRKSDWDAYYKNIADHMVKGEKLVITPEWSRRPIHILDLTVRGAKLGKSLPAKYK
ncbi:MAG: Gfo/Idh/MocA family oxidoreductase [Phycisphaerae bacterium]|nr:Gfo/Idh/MocA family oxidoreductase [Phycisphaerae bacterium]